MFKCQYIFNLLTNSAPTISHHATVGTVAVKRLLSHKKTFFYNTACSERLALGEIAAHGQPYHTLTLAFDTTSLQQLVAFNTEQGVAMGIKFLEKVIQWKSVYEDLWKKFLKVHDQKYEEFTGIIICGFNADCKLSRC